MTDVSIRRAEPRDVPEVQHVATNAWNAIYDGTLSQETIDAAIDEWYDSGVLLEYVQDPAIAVFVADDGTGVRGYVTGASGDEPRVGELGAIYVHPDDWRVGIGSKLLTQFENYGEGQAWDAIQIRVLAENDVARSFYERHEYEPTGDDTVTLFDERTAEVVYRKRL